MVDSLAGIVLAAGSGTRLSPLTLERPKALCPVGGTALVDLAVDRLARICDDTAVNAHHQASLLAAHLDGRVHLSVERELLGTGGALGQLRPWIDGRAVVVVNADAVHGAALAPLVRGWDGERVRFLLAEPPGRPFGWGVRLCAALMPWAAVRDLPASYGSIHDRVWAPWAAAGRVEVIPAPPGPWFDCGTPADYLAANLWTSDGDTVVGAGAAVLGTAVRSVIWDGARVDARERLVDAVRTTQGRTVLVR
jgi:NDP-sugar pyrophosphorylase family protein